MSSKLHIEPRIRSLTSYLSDIEKGTIQIPAFQRDFVWNRDNIKDLFDSIKNKYPIGSILLWKPESPIWNNKEKIGSYYVQKEPQTPTTYILDGFQRFSSLFGCLTNPNKTLIEKDKEEWEELFNLYYDLEEEVFLYLRPRTSPQPYQIPVYVLMNSGDFRQYARKEFDEKIKDEEKIERYYDRADKLSVAFTNYQIASIDINDANIEEAVDIFSRINSKGTSISIDWMVNALSLKEGFRFGDEIDTLLEELKIYSFDRIDRNAIFRCIQSSFGKIYFDDTNIEALAKRPDFISVTKASIPKIKRAIQFLYEDLLVVDSKLLPYNIQLVFIMDFFKVYSNPTSEQYQKLKEWFWITTYSNYFTLYSLSTQRKAYAHFQNFLKGNENFPVFNDKPEVRFSTAKFPEKILLKGVRSKALILFLLNYANKFEHIETNKILGYTLARFFPESSDVANTIPVLLTTENMELLRNNDISEALKTDPSCYFITTNWFHPETDKKEEFKKRKQLIQTEEKKFIESLGVEYL